MSFIASQQIYSAPCASENGQETQLLKINFLVVEQQKKTLFQHVRIFHFSIFLLFSRAGIKESLGTWIDKLYKTFSSTSPITVWCSREVPTTEIELKFLLSDVFFLNVNKSLAPFLQRHITREIICGKIYFYCSTSILSSGL